MTVNRLQTLLLVVSTSICKFSNWQCIMCSEFIQYFLENHHVFDWNVDVRLIRLMFSWNDLGPIGWACVILIL